MHSLTKYERKIKLMDFMTGRIGVPHVSQFSLGKCLGGGGWYGTSCELHLLLMHSKYSSSTIVSANVVEGNRIWAVF